VRPGVDAQLEGRAAVRRKARGRTREHVAKLAGLPRSVLDRARTILTSLEVQHTDDQGKPRVPQRKKNSQEKQLLLFGETLPHPVIDQLKELNLDQMTPLDALNKLHDLHKKL
jgi:DNA mismatch repair protein MutS